MISPNTTLAYLRIRSYFPLIYIFLYITDLSAEVGKQVGQKLGFQAEVGTYFGQNGSGTMRFYCLFNVQVNYPILPSQSN